MEKLTPFETWSMEPKKKSSTEPKKVINEHIILRHLYLFVEIKQHRLNFFHVIYWTFKTAEIWEINSSTSA